VPYYYCSLSFSSIPIKGFVSPFEELEISGQLLGKEDEC
jgi:hypothetical protein